MKLIKLNTKHRLSYKFINNIKISKFTDNFICVDFNKYVYAMVGYENIKST